MGWVDIQVSAHGRRKATGISEEREYHIAMNSVMQNSRIARAESTALVRVCLIVLEAVSNIYSYFSPFTHPVQLFNTRLTNVLQLFKITGGNDKQGFPMKQGGMFALSTNTTRRPN